MVSGWDGYFMALAYTVASRSKDGRTHYGAVVVGPKREIRSTGYNGFVRGVDDSAPERHERPEKYHWTEHAERNAVDMAAFIGVSLAGCTMYVQGVPCSDCARSVVQSGIREVVVHGEWVDGVDYGKWVESIERTKTMFAEAGVLLRVWRGRIPPPGAFLDGKDVSGKVFGEAARAAEGGGE